MSFKYRFILLFLLFSLSSQRLRGYSIPGKDSFIHIKNGEQTLIELSNDKKELYYSFDNIYDSSDIIILTKYAHQYTTTMYFYDSYENIKTNSDGEYINYIKDLDLSEKLNYITSSKKCTYYIIIKDAGGYSSKDYITIFNEKDTLELKEDQPFIIPMFFQNNNYTFTFNGEKDEIIYLDININNIDFSQSIIILKNNVEIMRAEKNKGIIPLNEDKEKGIYKIYISSINNEIYKNIKSSIILRKSNSKVRLLEPEKEIKLYYSNSNDFFFYVNLDNYELNEENIITFKISHNAYKNKLIQYCYAKNMNFKEFDDNKFISNMPSHEEESESYFNKLNTLEIINHLYFSRNKPIEQNTKSFLLVHCNIKIEDDKYFDPEEINIYLSSQSSNIDFSDKNKINEIVNIKEYIPKIYKIKLPIKDNKSYIFYTNVKIQAIYENTMLNSDYNKEELMQIYAISNTKLKNEKDNYKIIYIKLFGAEQKINFKAESTDSEIYFTYTNSNIRPYKTINQQHLNCGDSFYFIGSYSSLISDSYFFLEEIYGKYDLYYKNEILDNDDTILTNGNTKYLINSKIGSLSKTFDIIELKSTNPGYFNLHLIKNSFMNTLVLYQRQISIVSKGTLYIHPSIKTDQSKINIEISTPLGKEIYIKSTNIDTKIDSSNRYLQIEYNKETIPNDIKLDIKEDLTVISIKLTDNNLYKIVDGTSAKINEENIIFKLKNEQTYKNVNITINRVFNDYTYTIFKGDLNYGIDMILSGYDTIPLSNKNTINFILSNPYIKYNQMISDKNDSPFYISFHVNDPEGYQKDISIIYNNIDTYDEWENFIIKTLPSDINKKYSLKIDKGIEKLSILYQSCGNSLKEINLYNYDDIINSFKIKNRFNLGIFNNYYIPQQIGPIFINDEGNKYTGAQISLSLKEISQKEIDDLNDDNKYYLSQNGKVLKWNTINGVKEYIIYIFNQKNENIKYIQNICYLDTIRINDLKNETDPNYIGIYTTKNNSYNIKEEGIYIITVVANLENIKFIFKEFKYDSSLPPHDDSDDNKDDDGNNTLVIVLSIVIPIIIIIIIIIIVIIYKRRNQDIEKDLPSEDDKIGLIRDTTNSNNEN